MNRTAFRLFAAVGLIFLASEGYAQTPYAKAERLYTRVGLDAAVATYMPAAKKADSEAEFCIGATYVFAAWTAKNSAHDWEKAKAMENQALQWFKRSRHHGNQKAAKLLDIVNANDSGVLYVSTEYVMNGTKPPPEWSFPDKPLARKR